MKIVYDETKRRSNLRKHGLDFADVDLSYFLRSVIVPVKSGRLMAIGRHGDVVTAVVFSTLGREAASIISFRTASKKERASYEQTQKSHTASDRRGRS